MQGNVRLFEIGSVFEKRAGALPREELRVGVLIMGRRTPPHFTDPKSPEFQEWARYDHWDARAFAEMVAGAAFSGQGFALRESQSPDNLWEVIVGEESVGVVRRVALDAPVWAAPAFGIEITLGELDASQIAPPGSSAYRPATRPSPSVARYQPLPTTPASEFDLALVVPDAVRGEQIESVIQRVSGKLLERVELFDRYVGQGVEVGHRSLAWRLTFRHAERTLRDREIEARRSDILKALADELNVRPRAT
jgi:phenylalanyl-tRNA synthetase beta chain